MFPKERITMVTTVCRRLFAVTLVVASLCWIPISYVQSGDLPAVAPDKAGILLLAHGGSKEWNANVQAIAAQVDQTQPTEVAFGMADRVTLQAGIDKLLARGVKRIVAVPLFVSSHSSVIEATRYLLGLRADAPPDLMDFAMDHGSGGPATTASEKNPNEAMKTKPVTCPVPLQLSPALDHHAVLAQILADRATAISRAPAREVLILVAHGPNDDQENILWLADLSALAKQIASQKPFARIEVATLRDDADPPIRDKATEQLRSFVALAGEKNLRALIVPVFLSYGGIENGLRKRLDGLDHVMSPAGLLPDARLAEWVSASANTPSKQ
jgi:sirohydrochlorin ferrochelatase